MILFLKLTILDGEIIRISVMVTQITFLKTDILTFLNSIHNNLSIINNRITL